MNKNFGVNHRIIRSCLRIFICLLLTQISPINVFAETIDRVSLTLTPSTFEINLDPGDSWSSAIKIINPNLKEITVYLQAVNFKSQGAGTKSFALIKNENPEVFKNTLAGWINLPQNSFTIGKEKSVEVPFSLEIPEDAPPGGHYAAILVGTAPLGAVDKSVSSFISSLVLVRVSGKVDELGRVEKFKSTKKFNETEKIDFVFNFVNDGNVHLEPSGSIIIYDLWGQERNRLIIKPENNDSKIILPDNYKEFVISFTTNGSLALGSGIYRAQLLLNYGQDNKKEVSGAVYFFIIPIRRVLFLILIFGIFILILLFLVRIYVNKILAKTSI